MKISTIEHERSTVARKIGYTITGLLFALLIVPVFVIGVYTILTALVSP
jgi:hypothetical protein